MEHYSMELTLKEKILRQKKLDYVNQEIKNYERAIKVGSNPIFNDYNVSKANKLRLELEAI
jgi:hypothetical protein